MGHKRNAYKILIRKLEGKRPTGRHRRRWEGIVMDLGGTVREVVGWMHLAQVRDQWRAVVNTVMNFWVRLKTWNFLIS
jgi:hypothetical protein